ncbi:MAG: gamma-butyrobetaine hydroxylase-like domain-containing protein, partial [Rhodospirillaceae bacterium]|nr:gamma-butyrobetaine hydroxylase-like domain-containing protein [Rhodospirillaceae bacterium]
MNTSTASAHNPRGQQHKPTEIRLNREDNKLEIDFEGGEKFSITAELLRVESPSAEIQGHSPDEKKIIGGRKNVAIMELKPVG